MAGIGQKKKILLFIADVAIMIMATVFAFLLRFEFRVPNVHLESFGIHLLIAVPIFFSAFLFTHVYKVSYRFAGLSDAWRILKAIFYGAVIYTPIAFWAVPEIRGSLRVPISVVLIYIVLTLLGTMALRFSGRIFRELIWREDQPIQDVEKILIVGAGDAADQLLRHIQRMGTGQSVVGLLDDDPSKQGSLMHGAPILGAVKDLENVLSDYSVDTVVVAIASVERDLLRYVFTTAQKSGVSHVRVLRTDLISGEEHLDISVKDVRDVEVEDLLGRDPVTIETESIEKYIAGARVLITGASGSIGSEIVRQVCRYAPADVRCVDIDETGLFDLHRGLAGTEFFEPVVEVADVRDYDRMTAVFEDFKPQVVFHAAAYKHVPMMERYPEEAVRTNILGTYNVARLSSEFNSEKFIFISTDKAVNPRNVMGASKRVAGKLVCGLQRDEGTQFMTVRFGNVLGSRGSVIPIFLDQLRRGGPLTVTHPEMERFFMTIPEAVSLVLQTGAIGSGGEVFVLDMGEPMKIVNLAEEIIRMHGREPYEDVQIEFVGLRPGEKLYEELLTAEEGTTQTRHEKIMAANLAPDEAGDKPEVIVQSFENLKQEYNDLQELRSAIVQQLKHWVPSYSPNREGL